MPDDKTIFDLLHPQPLLIVISGTSGVGKDSVIDGLKRRGLPLHFVITATAANREKTNCMAEIISFTRVTTSNKE